ncbi:MAG: hypothetical protein KAT43_06185 [Nanoarchaeota archaeon]|nr:hypothetical protein [Nanoarchaeota archaeon]
MSNPVYLSVADRQIESFLSPGGFERSLVLNVLFQSSIVLPDIFFFISGEVERHVLDSGPQSLLEACIERNIVRPAFRDGTCSSFLDALNIIKGNGNSTRAIQGVRESAEELARRLSRVTENPSFKPFVWPREIGEDFAKLIQTCLTTDSVPEVGSECQLSPRNVKLLWQRTAKWRKDCVEEALSKTKQIAGKGLRRGELMNAIGRSLGIRSGHKVQDIRELRSVVGVDYHERFALNCFLNWMCQLYHWNQASAFGATVSLPTYDETTPIGLSAILPQSPPSSAGGKVITVQVSIPPTDVIARLRPNELIAIRSDLGSGYLAALGEWQREPTEENEAKVRSSLAAYAEGIRKESSKRNAEGEGLLEAVLAPGKHPARKVMTGLFVVGGAVATMKWPWMPPFLALGPVGYALYRWHCIKTENSQVELRSAPAGVKRQAEVNVEDLSVASQGE